MSQSNIQIEWLCSARAKTILDLENSNLASVRLRTAIGMKAAESLGFSNLLSDGQFHKPVPLAVVGKIDYISDPQRPYKWLRRLEELKTNGSKIIIDYTDNHLAGNSPASQFYKEAINISDQVITSSSRLSKHLLAFCNKEVQIIEDPIEVPIQEPTIKDRNDRTALWFGHASNLPFLFDYLLNKFKSKNIKSLILMTNAVPFPQEFCDLLNVEELKDLEISVIPWSTGDLIKASKLCDLCIIPTDPSNPVKNGASSNRLLTSIALGLPTAASFIDSYKPFCDFSFNLDEINIDDILLNPKKIEKKIKAGQKIIIKYHSINVAQSNWAKYFSL